MTSILEKKNKKSFKGLNLSTSILGGLSEKLYNMSLDKGAALKWFIYSQEMSRL